MANSKDKPAGRNGSGKPATVAPKKSVKKVQPAPVQAPEQVVDPTPEQEAEGQVSNGPGQIDGSGILTHTNEDVIKNFPKNDQGQVVIGEDGQIVGLEAGKQPRQPSGSA